MTRTLRVPTDGAPVTAWLYDSVGKASAALVLAHGAGAGQAHPFLVSFAQAIAACGIDVLTFNFPYKEAGRALPDRAVVLEACYRRVVDVAGREAPGSARGLFIGGKSMGGRIATQVVAADPSLPVRGLVLLGYPLHPPGQPDKRRDAHLPRVGRPVLFVQGARDTFGTPEELGPVLRSMTPTATLHAVDGADHSLAIKGSSRSQRIETEQALSRTIADWIGTLAG